MLTKEQNAAKRAAGTPETMLTWLDEFYDRHALTLQEAIGPAVEACRLAGVEVSPASVFIAEHLKRSRQDLLAATECKASALAGKVTRCVDDWLSAKAGRLVAVPTRDIRVPNVTTKTKEGSDNVQTTSDN